jgi:N-acyl amino acid synthase of PEP-CTERM/exosortase system
MHLSFASHHRNRPNACALARHPVPSAIAESAVFREIAALRYEVYCLERGYLDSQQYPESVEIDEFDERSTHIAAHTHDNLLVGTVRLVQAELQQSFPLEARCSFFNEFRLPPRQQCGEVSRLIVRKNYRGGGPVFPERRRVLRASQLPRTDSRRSSSAEILLGLYREMYHHSRKVGIRYWFAAMEKPLARALNQMGFQFTPVGPEADYSGPVTPFVADLDELMADLSRANPTLSAWFAAKPT